MSWWFKSNPRLLEAECKAIDSNSNYKEHFRHRGNLLVSCGEVIVRLDKTTKYPVLFVFPESTPFSLPRVYLLQKPLIDDELKQLSEGNSLQAVAAIQSNIHFYSYWHQNPDGSLCLLEQDNLEKYGEYISITDVINRTRDWLAGLTTGNHPPDGPEVEIFSHFRNHDFSVEFLLPEQFYTTAVVQGEFYCTLASHVYKGIQFGEKRIFLGILLHGQTKAGIYTPFEYGSKTYLLPDGISTPVDLIQKTEIVEKEIKVGRMLKGYWWTTDVEIKSFSTITDFALLVGNGNLEEGCKRVFGVAGNEFKNSNDKIYIGLVFKNRRGENQWQSFLLAKKAVTEAQVILGSNKIEDLTPLLNNYEIKAIRNEKLTDEQFHLRNHRRADRKVMKEKAITLLGCGALGGEVGDTLGKAGVGIMALVDLERMKVGNSIRHVIGTNQQGMAKVHAMMTHIHQHNPFIEIVPIPCDLLNAKQHEYFVDESVGISTVANDNVECFVNEQAVIGNRTIFYARALRGGKAARIFRVIPGKDACFYCLSLYRDENNLLFIDVPVDESLPTITNECNNPIRPGSAADLKLIAAITSRIMMDYLQSGATDENHWVWSTENLTATKPPLQPFNLHSSFIPPHSDCPYCKPEKQLTVSMSQAVLNFMQAETRKNTDIETGGVLLGSVENGVVVIRYASEPGPKAIKKRTEFLKDKEFTQKFVNEHFAEHGEKAVYVGEWHYHPFVNNKPSGTDINSLTNIANGAGYLTNYPAMIILNNKGEASCTVHPVNKSYYFTTPNIQS